MNDSVLVYAEDESLVRHTVGELLSMLGLDVRACGNGAEAVSLCRALRPRWAILDLNMPVMDGFEAARRIRCDLPDIQLVALTGRADHAAQGRAKEAGFDRFIAKPVDLGALSRALDVPVI